MSYNLTLAGYYTPTPAQQFEILDKFEEKSAEIPMDLQAALKVINKVVNNRERDNFI